jgi:type I restriction enzyme S subunit
MFGSRIHGTAKPWSDLDLAIKPKSPLDWNLLAEIKEAFQESELPFRVDIVDWNDITESFRKAIETNGYEMLQ